MASLRIKEETIKQYGKTLSFDELFNLTLQQIEYINDVLQREKEKKMGGKSYSAHSLKKARLLSLNIADLLHIFRTRSIEWEKERKKEKDGTQKTDDSASQE